MRLSGQSAGTVEVLYDNEWLPVCEKDWHRGYGIVICRQTGYSTYLNSYPNSTVRTGPTLVGVSCTGLEGNLTYCNQTGVSSISSTCSNIVIKCSGKVINEAL